jgi:hypothetical protein
VVIFGYSLQKQLTLLLQHFLKDRLGSTAAIAYIAAGLLLRRAPWDAP